MIERLRRHFAANVVGYISLMVAVVGLPTAWAIGRNSVGAPQIKPNAVGRSEHKDNSVGSTEVINDSLLSEDFAPGQLPAGTQGQQGPQGEQGLQGKQGLQGEQGLQGASSWSADCNEGLSAGDVTVRAGSFCIDKYEASVWTQPNGGTQLTTAAAIDAACPENGQPTVAAPCTDFYARSVLGVGPARNITWFQAQQALANSGKRLPTNAEWQQAVSGTPNLATDNDTSDCNLSFEAGEDPVNTGSRSACVSRFGAFDMVGNLWEWVADWDEQAEPACPSWPAEFGTDTTCLGDGTPSHFPGALIRGGGFFSSTGTGGAFAVSAVNQPSTSDSNFGFRGAR